MNILRKPSLKYLKGETKVSETSLKKSLNWFNIAVLAISMSVGAGIFSVGAEIINEVAGPAAIISFAIAGIVCALAAMCYAEYSCKIPVAGASYIFTYATVGELVAWILGWNMILGLTMAVSTVIHYWCIYLYETLNFLHINAGPIMVFGTQFDLPILIGGILVTLVLCYSTKSTASAANFFTILKVIIVLVVVIAGAFFFNSKNLQPFFLEDSLNLNSNTLIDTIKGVPGHYGGWEGVLAGAAIATFAFLGFETATTAAEETKKPRKNMPLGLIVGIIVVSTLYILVSLVCAGMTSSAQYHEYMALHPEVTPSLATSFQIVAQSGSSIAGWIGFVISLGAFVGLSGVVLVGTLGIIRTVFAISRDGLLPSALAKTGGPNKTPILTTIICGSAITLLGLFADTSTIAQFICIATLSSFTIVSFSVPILRKNKKLSPPNDNHKFFEVPFNPVFPIISGVACIWLMLNLKIQIWQITGVWVLLGLLIYAVYGYRKSKFGKHLLEKQQHNTTDK